MICSLQTQQQIAVQGQQVAQTAEGQTIVYQPVNADGTILPNKYLENHKKFYRDLRNILAGYLRNNGLWLEGVPSYLLIPFRMQGFRFY